MRASLWMSLCVGALAACANAGTISYSVTSLGGNEYQYAFTTSGITFAANTAVSFDFSAALYANGALSSPGAPSGFITVIEQPNNPTGDDGFFDALSTVSNPTLNVPFTIDVAYGGSGTPGPVSWTLNSYTQSGPNYILQTPPLDSGTTGPEPSSLLLGSSGVLMGLGVAAIRRRRARLASNC